jgi:hypothetical protein
MGGHLRLTAYERFYPGRTREAFGEESEEGNPLGFGSSSGDVVEGHGLISSIQFLKLMKSVPLCQFTCLYCDLVCICRKWEC